MATQTLSISLNHLCDLDLYQKEKPYELWLPVPEGRAKTNVEFELCRNIPLQDARSHLQDFDLETTGFMFFEQPWVVPFNSDSVRTEDGKKLLLKHLQYMSEVCQSKLGAQHVLCYDWRVRKASKNPVKATPTFFDIPSDVPAREFTLDAAQQVHADESPEGVNKILQHLLTPTEKEDLESGLWRLRIINFWRPLVPVVQNRPLALCDRRTVLKADWEPIDKVHADWVEEGMYLRHKDNHKWCWISSQTKDEVTAFVVWDSINGTDPCISVPHCSFELSGRPADEPPRESIELRFLVWNRI